jgi:ribosomal protein S18 acetylase RimI-like enzyme
VVTRLASVSDEAAVLALDEAGSAGGDERRALVRAAIDAGECTVCEHEGRVLGFVVSKPGHFFGRDFVELLIVAPTARRQGVGRRLLRAALASARTRRVFTSTNRSNDAMRALLRTEGWSSSGELDGLDPGDPELVFYRDRA